MRHAAVNEHEFSQNVCSGNISDDSGQTKPQLMEVIIYDDTDDSNSAI